MQGAGLPFPPATEGAAPLAPPLQQGEQSVSCYNLRQNLNILENFPSHIFPGAENQFECFKCFVILYRLESEKKIPSSQKACIYLITGGDDLVGFGNGARSAIGVSSSGSCEGPGRRAPGLRRGGV